MCLMNLLVRLVCNLYCQMPSKIFSCLLQLDMHPRAPQLFTALLQHTGVESQLVPLLAEPARSAVQVSLQAQRAGGYA